MSKKQPVIIIGGGGHASVLVDILKSQNRDILAVVSPDILENRKVHRGLCRLKYDCDVDSYHPSTVLLVNGIGPDPRLNAKRKVNEYFLEKGYQFDTVVSSSAIVSPYSVLSEGVQILNGAIIQAGVSIGPHSVVNTGVVVEHDCHLGAYNHLAPSSTLCGQVVTKQNVYIGAGAIVINNVVIGEEAIVGAGAVLKMSLDKGQICYPAQSLIK